MNNFRLQLLIVIGGALILVGKFAAFLLTGSNAIFSDAMESIVNVMAGVFTLYSIWLASKPRDREHPYGHGKVEFLAAGFEGGMIFVAGAGILAKSVMSLIEPAPIGHLDMGILLVAISGALNFLFGHLLEKRGAQSHSPAMVTSGKHLKSDAWSTLGLLCGLALVYFTQMLWIDSAVAIIFGALIMYMGFQAVRESLAGIMDEADFKLLNHIVEIIQQHRRPTWIDVHNLRVIKYGDVLHIDCHITLPWYLSVKEGHDEAEDLHTYLMETSGRNVEIFIHVDPCVPTSCSICSVENCSKRQHPYSHTLEWDLERVLANQKHQ